MGFGVKLFVLKFVFVHDLLEGVTFVVSKVAWRVGRVVFSMFSSFLVGFIFLMSFELFCFAFVCVL